MTYLNSLLARAVTQAIRVFRLPGLNSPHIYALWGIPFIQPYIEAFGRKKALAVLCKARRECPAYRKFLEEHSVPEKMGVDDFSSVPPTEKQNYVKKFTIEERCHGGALPPRGVVIDESSGSSGVPNNWVRGTEERGCVKRLIQHSYALRYGSEPVIVANCFALGPWATGMNVSMALVDLAILKSIGPDKAKLESTLSLFGNRYRYLLAGYPPFFKDWLSSTSLDLSSYELHLVIGGEGLSEGLRDFFLQKCRSVHSSYGASDLEINIGAETELSIALRRYCLKHPSASKALFGREDPPMIFQYNPIDYLIERSADGELIATVLRFQNAAPKIRYNIKDIGGSLSYREMIKRLKEAGAPFVFSERHAALPFLFVYGRNDLSIPFYGSKVFTTDLDQILNDHEALRGAFYAFQLRSREEATLEKTLVISLERSREPQRLFSDQELQALLFVELKRVNQDFREVSKLFGAERLEIHQHDFGSGPFAARDIRVKNKYISG